MWSDYSMVVEASHKQGEYTRRAMRERRALTLRTAQPPVQADLRFPLREGWATQAHFVVGLLPRFSHRRVIAVLLGRAAA